MSALPFRPCVLIPTFNNPVTIGGVVAAARRHLGDVLIVDDGSGDEARRALDELSREGVARVTRRDQNGGKGAAVKTGFEVARGLGFTHAVQIDADGQHDTDDIPRFLALAAERPDAAVLGHPVFDETMPRGRRAAHGLTNFWCRVETAGPVITDPQCGFRVYPLDAAAGTGVGADRMAFDIEIAVRLAWAGVPIINVPTRVRYLPREGGGVSHFRPVRDNVTITWMHVRLVVISIFWRLGRLLREGPLTAPAPDLAPPAAPPIAAPSAAASPAVAPPPVNWLDVAEKGSATGAWIIAVVGRLLGRAFARLLLLPIVLYFVVLSPTARRASREYLRRMGLPARFGAVFAHCLRFAHCTLDRLYWVTGRESLFRVTRQGSEHLQALAREGRGALLIGAHMGSFEAMRGMAHRKSVPLNIVGYFKNARFLNNVLERLNPGLATRVISVERSMDFVLRLKERIDAGEVVALLGDRIGLGDKTCEVDFLGGRARFPAGPYLLASALDCPVYLAFGLFHEPNRYDLYCEPFAERIELPRRTREAGATAWAQKYAERLEHYCRMAPDNWFNFYEVWKVQS